MSWLRRNRWSLPLLPVCLALMLVASGYRVQHFWWDTGLRRLEGTARAGAPLTVTDHYDDAYGAAGRTFTVRLSGVQTQRRMPDFDGPDSGDPPPPGARAVAVRLAWSAAPDQVLDGCTVELKDDHGRRYAVPQASDQAEPCVPEGHEGPLEAGTGKRPRGYVAPGTERPASWVTTVVFEVPRDVHITEVLLWWEMPHYVVLETS